MLFLIGLFFCLLSGVSQAQVIESKDVLKIAQTQGLDSAKAIIWPNVLYHLDKETAIDLSAIEIDSLINNEENWFITSFKLAKNNPPNKRIAGFVLKYYKHCIANKEKLAEEGYQLITKYNFKQCLCALVAQAPSGFEKVLHKDYKRLMMDAAELDPEKKSFFSSLSPFGRSEDDYYNCIKGAMLLANTLNMMGDTTFTASKIDSLRRSFNLMKSHEWCTLYTPKITKETQKLSKKYADIRDLVGDDFTIIKEILFKWNKDSKINRPVVVNGNSAIFWYKEHDGRKSGWGELFKVTLLNDQEIEYQIITVVMS